MAKAIGPGPGRLDLGVDRPGLGAGGVGLVALRGPVVAQHLDDPLAPVQLDGRRAVGGHGEAGGHHGQPTLAEIDGDLVVVGVLDLDLLTVDPAAGHRGVGQGGDPPGAEPSSPVNDVML